MNPYDLPDDDSDILGSSSKHQKYRGEIRGPNGEELPPELQEALQSYLGTGAYSRQASSLPIELRAMAGMLEFYNDFSTFRMETPLVTAMADLLNKMTDGELELHVRFRECERKLTYTGVILRFQQALARIIKEKLTESYNNEVIHYVESLIDIITFQRGQAVQEYRTLAERLGRECDEGLIENSIYNYRDWITRLGMAHPPAKSEDGR